jgi:hypothetical protein
MGKNSSPTEGRQTSVNTSKSDAPKGIRESIKLMNELPALTPVHMDLIRRKVLSLIATNLESAAEVLDGKRAWNTAQVHLFRTLLNKVLPDLSMSHSIVDVRHKRAEELSRAELEAIASGEYESFGTVLHEDGAIPAGSIAYAPVVPQEGGQPSRIVRDADLVAPDPPGGP